MIPLPLYSLTPLSKVTIPSWKISGSPHFVSLLSLPVVLMLPAKPSFPTNASSAPAMLLLYYLFLCCPLTVGFLPLCSMHSSSVILLPWLPASSFKLVVLRLVFLALLQHLFSLFCFLPSPYHQFSCSDCVTLIFILLFSCNYLKHFYNLLYNILPIFYTAPSNI